MNEASRAPLRSPQWFGRQDRDGFAYRSWLKALGIPNDQFDGRPVIGICNTFSELTPCNSHIRVLAEQVKMGVLEAGGCAAACGRHTAQAPGPLAPGGRLWLRSRLGGETAWPVGPGGGAASPALGASLGDKHHLAGMNLKHPAMAGAWR